MTKSDVEQGIATEAIDFQRDGFGKELEEHFERLRQGKVRPGFGKDYAAGVAIERLIFDRLGMTVNIEFQVKDSLHIRIPNLVDNHVFNSSERRKLLTDANKTDKSFTTVQARVLASMGMVDSVRAKVSGSYSDIVHTLSIPTDLVNITYLTIPEVVGAVIHELGHGFTMLEYMGKKTTMNEILALVVEDSFVLATTEQRKFIFSAISHQPSPEFLQGLSDPNPEVRIAVTVDEFFEPRVSALGSMRYDAVSCEALADDFTAKFGYARENMIGLDKLSRHRPERNPYARSILLSGEIATYGLTAFLSVTNPLIAAMLLLVPLYRLMGSGEASRNFTYDKLRVRYQRLREGVIRSLKDPNLPPDVVAKAISDIKIMNKVIASTQNVSSLMDKFLNFFVKKHRDEKTTQALHRQLEEMASNDLFIKAAQLRTGV